MRRVAIAILLCALSAQAQHSVIKTKEPQPNLGQLKTRLTTYYSCKEATCYVPQIESQSDKAIAILKREVAKAKPGDKLALVLDIDETSLSNWTEESQDDYGYIAKDWNDWIHQHSAPAIDGTLRLYHEAKNSKVAVFFITGRPESQREDTETNLKAAGYGAWDGLAFRADDHPKTQTVTDYKSGERGKVVAQGYRIILNVGDQLSDLNGNPQAEHSVKLPNPFYFIP
ncbi:MAG TPA: HAD family acid phosphatase [Alloacidobacterium sp.]|nr:HAD family acid phosphatase [Alloacidobacterium sp.]